MSHLYDGWSVRLQYLHAVRLLLANCHTLNLPNVVKFEIVNVRAQLTVCDCVLRKDKAMECQCPG
jgi:hypothetical protein